MRQNNLMSCNKIKIIKILYVLLYGQNIGPAVHRNSAASYLTKPVLTRCIGDVLPPHKQFASVNIPA